MHATTTRSRFVAMVASHPHEFKACTTDWKELRSLVMIGLLQENNLTQWEVSGNDFFSMSNGDQVVVFSQFFLHGFGLPSSQSSSVHLDYYQIERIHLNLDCIVFIGIFSHVIRRYLCTGLYTQ